MGGSDVRVCFVGDSFVAGVGDPVCAGWAGRVAAVAHGAGVALTAYNLGVRRQTSTDIAKRWFAECAQRLPSGVDGRVVFSFGVNDTMEEDGVRRVPADASAANLVKMLGQAADRGWSALVVEPPPVDDDAHNTRIARLGDRFASVCAEEHVPFVRVHEQLRADEVWLREVRAGDGAHPSAGGYEAFAALVTPAWLDWLAD
ncbi:GDSL-type esterase/lipase family protein [Nocardia puris]|uniref:Lysophospholipase L1-like esterase n=1 Tax=Nocardia puris TaxID=208602 RepID=A0A366DN92_9NOCA|nr:GDSL-type esterase/lipase family protein [Nocardia puris]RBO91560.1 lysophospholipase L1-like esterase [Nocardia puris]